MRWSDVGDNKSFCFLWTEQHFPEVVASEEFLNLGMEQVSSLIASDKLTIPTEEKVGAGHIPAHASLYKIV